MGSLATTRPSSPHAGGAPSASPSSQAGGLPAWLAYAALIIAALIVMVHDPVLRPSYRNLFFTTHISLIPLTLVGATMPLVLLHESYHALAGRRLGLPSRLSIGRRLVYLVAETRMDALFSVPRRDRYLPFLAGMLADAVVTSVLTLLAAVLRYGEAPTWLWGLLLAIAFTCVLRLLWQFLFYLETERIWIFLTPAVALAAGVELSRRARGEGAAVVLAVFLLVLILSGAQELLLTHYR